MRQTSDSFLEAIYAQESAEVMLPLVRLDHPSWADPLRLVADTQPLESGGETYNPWAFAVSLPDDEDEGMPVLNWRADNVDPELVRQFRTVTDKIFARVFWVLASTPDVVEAGPFDVEMTAVDYDAQTVGGTMTLEPILDEQFGYLTMTPSMAPGLF